MIIERNAEFVVLTQALHSISRGGGQFVLVLVRGEAGIGKSTFIDHFLSEIAGPFKTAIAWCDPLTALIRRSWRRSLRSAMGQPTVMGKVSGVNAAWSVERKSDSTLSPLI